MSERRPERIKDEYALKVARLFRGMVYYNVHGLILAGTPVEDITLVETVEPELETIVSIKGHPIVKIRMQYNAETLKMYVQELILVSINTALLDEFLASRKSQPPAI